MATATQARGKRIKRRRQYAVEQPGFCSDRWRRTERHGSTASTGRRPRQRAGLIGRDPANTGHSGNGRRTAIRNRRPINRSAVPAAVNDTISRRNLSLGSVMTATNPTLRKSPLERRTSVEAVADVLSFPPSWVRTLLSSSLDGEISAFVTGLRRAWMQAIDPLERAHLGMALMHAGPPEGGAAFISALAHHDVRVRRLAVCEIGSLAHRDLARDASPGRVAVTAAEFALAITPYLSDQFVALTDHGNGWHEWNRERFVRAAAALAFDDLLPQLQCLRSDSDLRVALAAVEQFVQRDLDLETLGHIEAQLNAAAHNGNERAWQRCMCRMLNEYARAPGGRHRQAAAAIAGNQLRQMLDAARGPSGLGLTAASGLDPAQLISALVAPRPPFAHDLLQNILSRSDLAAALRAEALIGLDTLGHPDLERRPQVIDELLGATDNPDLQRCLTRLSDWGLVRFEELCAAVANPLCGRVALHLCLGMRRTPDQQAQLYRACRTIMFARLRASAGRVDYAFLSALLSVILSEQHTTELLEELRKLHAAAESEADHDFGMQRHALNLQQMLARVKASQGESTGAPWETVFDTWHRQGLRRQLLAELLSKAGARTRVFDAGPTTHALIGDRSDRLGLDDLIDLIDKRMACLEIQPDSQEPPYSSCWFDLSEIVRPAIKCEQLRQSIENDFDLNAIIEVAGIEPDLGECERLATSFHAQVAARRSFILEFDYEGRSFRYMLFDNASSRLDAPALINCFNDFLARIDHPQRLYPLEYFYQDDSWQMVIAADWRSVWPVQRILDIPMRGDMEW